MQTVAIAAFQVARAAEPASRWAEGRPRVTYVRHFPTTAGRLAGMIKGTSVQVRPARGVRTKVAPAADVTLPPGRAPLAILGRTIRLSGFRRTASVDLLLPEVAKAIEMTQNLATVAKSKMFLYYGVGIAAFTGALTTVAMLIWLANHLR